LVEEITCYSLPYGALGFISHILTYYTILLLGEGRSPLRPWTKLKHSSFDFCVSVLGLIGTMVLAIFTLVRCSHHWQLLLIGIWKLCMSVLNGVSAIYVSIVLRIDGKKAERTQHQNSESSPDLSIAAVVEDGQSSSQEAPIASGDEKVKKMDFSPDGVWGLVGACEWCHQFQNVGQLLMIPPDFFGVVVGLTGLISLIIHNWADHTKLHIITYVFSGAFVFFPLSFCLKYGFKDGYGLVLMAFIILAAPYGDWALGTMSDNLLGVPSGDSSALYWSYFILKRFTMLSS
jgi:hypothetical protein